MIDSAYTTVMVSDLSKAVRFYTKILNLPAGMRHGDNYAEVKAPGVAIGLHRKHEEVAWTRRENPLSVGFRVADLDQTAGLLRTNGMKMRVHENNVAKLAFFSDPDGTPLYFIQVK